MSASAQCTELTDLTAIPTMLWSHMPDYAMSDLDIYDLYLQRPGTSHDTVMAAVTALRNASRAA